MIAIAGYPIVTGDYLLSPLKKDLNSSLTFSFFKFPCHSTLTM